VAGAAALGTARGSFLGGWRLLAIDGFELDVPDSTQNAAEFGYAGSGANRSAFPKARVVALAECGTHAFVAAEVDAYRVGEKTLATRLYPRLRADELLTADRGFYSWPAWDAATATGVALLWRAPTQLDLPVVRVLRDGTYLSVLIKPSVRGARRDRILAALRCGQDLTAFVDALDDNGRPLAHLARVIEYEVPDQAGNGSGELIVLLSTITDPADAHADELAAAYHQRWEQETANDQLKTHLRGPGRVLRSRLPDLVHQEIWSYLIVHHAISALTAQASAAADLDPRPALVRQGPAPDPPYCHRNGGHSPLRTGPNTFRPTWPRSPCCSSHRGANAPALARSNGPGTTATESRNPVSRPAPATEHRPRSTSADSHPEQQDQIRLRGIGPRGGSDGSSVINPGAIASMTAWMCSHCPQDTGNGPAKRNTPPPGSKMVNSRSRLMSSTSTRSFRNLPNRRWIPRRCGDESSLPV
jgi:DDE family transposase